MATPEGSILALRPDATCTRRLESAFGDRLRVFHSDPELLEFCRSADVAFVIIPWRERDGNSMAITVSAIRASRRSPPVCVYCERTAESLHALARLSRAGASGVVVRDVDDDVISLRRLLHPRGLDRAVEIVGMAIHRVLPVRHHPLFLVCLEQLDDPLTAIEFARRLRVSRRTLSTWARRAGARGVRPLASKCRVLVAIELIRESRGSLEEVAHQLQFASSAHLHNTIHRYTGLAPRACLSRDAVAWCEVLFRHQDDRLALASRLPRKPERLPRNGSADLTIQHSSHIAGPVPGELTQ